MPASLDYAPTIPWQRRRRTRRAAIYLLALAVIALTFWIITPLIYARFSLIYWQSRCLDYTEPPPPTTAPSPITDRAAPPEFNEFLARFASPTFYTAEGWIPGYSHVYLHRRQSPAGQRLVVVELNYDPPRGGGLAIVHQTLRVTVIAPATLWSDPVVHPSRSFLIDAPEAPDTLDSWELVPGSWCSKALPAETDPADDSSFSLPLYLYYIVEPTDPPTVPTLHLHTYRFRLSPAGDVVDLVSITPPLPASPATSQHSP